MNTRMRKLFWRAGLVALLCLYLAATALTAFADGVSDEVAKYAKKLAGEEGVSTVVKVTRGSGSNQYQTNKTAASNGRNLYVFELINAQSYGNENSDMDFAIFWKTGNKVYYTYTEDNGGKYLQWDTHCQDSHKDLAGQTSGETYWGLRGGKRDILTIVLPYTDDTTEIIAVYFHKTGYATKAAGKHAWSGTSMKVARVDGTISSIGVDAEGMRYVNYGPNTTAYYVAGRESMTVCDYQSSCGTAKLTEQKWGHGLFKLNKLPLENANTSAHNSVYILEMVAGETGYVDMAGSVTIHYTNGLGMKLQKVLDFDTAYEQNYPKDDLFHISSENYSVAYNYPLSGALSSLSDQYMEVLASAYAENGYKNDVHDTLLRPYTGTCLSFVMTQDIASIDKIVVNLKEGSKTLVMQSLRLIQTTEFNGTNYFNGTYSMERTKSWKGHIIAQSKSIASIGAKSSFTYQGSTKSYGLDIYAPGQGPFLDNTGSTLGVSIHFADVLGGGIETLLAYNKESTSAWFAGEPALRNKIGSEQSQAYGNLSPLYQESITLEVTYKDTLGCTRKVQVPFVTTYLVKMLLDNKGDLTGGSRAQWIAGILQQNETAGITLRLAQYKELVSVKLSYGSGPEGFASTYKNDAIDTAKDPISLESICIYEGANDSNFRTVYNSYYKACLLETSLTPTWHWQASTEKGQQLSGSSSLTATIGGSGRSALKQGSPQTWSTKDKYLVQIITSDIQTAGTDDAMNVSFIYTNTAGQQITTNTMSIPTLAANYYGVNYKYASETHMYYRHVRRGCSLEFIVELPDAASVDAITLTLLGDNEYQFRAVRVYKLKDLSQRWAQQWTEDTETGNLMHLYWKRSFDESNAQKVASSSMVVQLYKNANQKTIYFTTYDENGNVITPETTEKGDTYLTSPPTSMTFAEAKQNLGLAVVKYTYLVDVKVADTEDAGSTNYFYFQLQFENGSSAVVLANQQLASDSFRATKHETFTINTTQNYGDLVSIRIICDHTSSTSDVFDKLNIETITVSLQGTGGVGQTWEAENIGWIDITYMDEGATIGVDGIEVSQDQQTLSNAQIVKDFPITGTASAVDLLFSITTANDSSSDASHTYSNALKGSFELTIHYLDTDGQEQSKTLDLMEQIKSYNDATRTMWMFRPNKTDRFVVSITDISSILSISITRNGGKSDSSWVISNVTVQQVAGMSDIVYMSSMSEYWRPYDSAQEVASSTNEAGATYAVGPNSSTLIAFTDNKIELVGSGNDSWSATISREPVTRIESLNVYVYSGTLMGKEYPFDNRATPLKLTLTYNNALGAPTQASFTIKDRATMGGETVLYAKGITLDGITTLTSLKLSTNNQLGDGPVVSHAIVQRVRSGVVVATYLVDFVNTDISVLGSSTASANVFSFSESMHQTVTLQPSADQKITLTPETYDVAVALRYTSKLDLDGSIKSVYQTPYVYLSDVGISSITSGKAITVPFQMPYVDRIVGICVVTTGPNVNFDNAIVYNYDGPAGDDSILLQTVGLDLPISAHTISTVVLDGGKMVLPAEFTFTTADNDMVSGAGTSGKATMIVHYTDEDGISQSVAIPDIFRFLNTASAPAAGSTVTLPIMLSSVLDIQSVEITAEDGWFITSLSIKLHLPDGTTKEVSKRVNNWAKTDIPLTVDLTESAAGSYLLGFGVNALTTLSGKTASAEAGSTLEIEAQAGESVVLTPEVWAIGSPDRSWSWNTTDSKYLSIQADGSAIYTIPAGLAPGQTVSVEVICGGDQRLRVLVNIRIVEVPAAPNP